MDRNQVTGFLLIGLLLIGYMYFTKPSAEELERQKHLQDSLKMAQTEQVEATENQFQVDSAIAKSENTIADTALKDTSDRMVQMQKLYGPFGKAAIGEEKFITLKNDKISVKLTTKGGRVYSAQVLGYKTHDGDPLILFYGDKNQFNINFFSQNKLISTENFYFQPVGVDTLVDASKSEASVTLRLKASDDEYIDFIYTLKPGSYLVDYSIKFHNVGNLISNNTTFLDLTWKTYMPALEQGEKWELQHMTIYYKYYQDEVGNLSERKDEAKEKLPTSVRWVSFKHQFFSSVLIAYDKFDNADLEMKLSDDPDFLKIMTAKIAIPYHADQDQEIKMAFFFGPNKYSLLKKIKLKPDDDLQLEKMIPLGKGIIRWVNRLVIIPLFNILGGFIHNFGIVILLMTLIIKLALSPLTYRSYMSSAKMRVLKPEIDQIISKIPEEKQMERQQATMDLYKKAGVSPMGGCLPMLIQLPILIAMYRFFPASIELRQQSFLWATDLSSYDAIIQWKQNLPLIGNHISLFSLLMAIAMFISTKLNSSAQDDSNPTAKTMKMFSYFMPVLMFIWFNNYSAALSYYYFLSNLITIGQIYVIRRMIDDEKLIAQLRTNMKKNKNKPTKSNFQKRLEEMQKQQQQQKKKKR